MSWQIKNIFFIFLTIVLFSFSLYLFFTKKVMINNTIENNIVEKKDSSNDFNYIDTQIKIIDSEIRENINVKNISMRNCKGMLEANKDNGLFSDTELFKKLNADREFKLDIIYDLCSYNFKKNNPISFIFFTKDMLNNSIKKYDNEYIPCVNIKTLTSGINSKKKGLIPLSFIADYF